MTICVFRVGTPLEICVSECAQILFREPHVAPDRPERAHRVSARGLCGGRYAFPVWAAPTRHPRAQVGLGIEWSLAQLAAAWGEWRAPEVCRYAFEYVGVYMCRMRRRRRRSRVARGRGRGQPTAGMRAAAARRTMGECITVSARRTGGRGGRRAPRRPAMGICLPPSHPRCTRSSSGPWTRASPRGVRYAFPIWAPIRYMRIPMRARARRYMHFPYGHPMRHVHIRMRAQVRGAQWPARARGGRRRLPRRRLPRVRALPLVRIGKCIRGRAAGICIRTRPRVRICIRGL